MDALDREGKFKFRLYKWGVVVYPEGSTAFEFQGVALGEFDKNGVFTEAEVPEYCIGKIWLVLKNGSWHDKNGELMRIAFGWNGDEAQLVLSPEHVEAIKQCEFIGLVKREEYENVVRYLIDQVLTSEPIIIQPSGDKAESIVERMKLARKGKLRPSTPLADTVPQVGTMPYQGTLPEPDDEGIPF